ncbi:MAG: Ureidoglycolate lyase [candidate division WS2 bacterium]|uniref:Ureidoglycolate lyase n=1 Tax=Psychracetigena formicireducens TaxID=2986056 RepID=A0A9E2F5K0_PSYF1|nr:Ureidoglycolate lyase [Candidatus Psychracetigena formicireducens]
MKIICIGRNYSEHIKELGNEVPEEPVVFLKPDSAILRNNETFYIPEFTNEVHYELELVIKINQPGKYIEKQFAHKYYDEIGLGVDFTARDIQQKLKEKGLPWEKAKGFNGSAPISNFVPKTEYPDLQNLTFNLLVNGETKQVGHTAQMIHTIDEIVVYVSKYFMLKIGDLIFTGTPSGVGKVNAGDTLQAYLEDKKMMQFLIK